MLFGDTFHTVRSLLQPNVVLIFLSVALLFVPTPWELFTSNRTSQHDAENIIDQTPFVLLPEPGKVCNLLAIVKFVA